MEASDVPHTSVYGRSRDLVFDPGAVGEEAPLAR